ncbi:MAG: phosphopentomutase, partial [Romboutsia timonensis]
YKGTDHTREQVPLLIYSKELIKPRQLEEMESFAVIGATIADNFNIPLPSIGCSILNKII